MIEKGMKIQIATPFFDCIIRLRVDKIMLSVDMNE